MQGSNSLRPADVEPVVRARLVDVLALNGSEVAEIEDGDRLDELGFVDLPAAWLLTELHVATGVDPFARERAFTDVRTVGELIVIYRGALEEVAAVGGADEADAADEAMSAPAEPSPLLGPVRDLGGGRFAASLLVTDAASDPERRTREAVVLEAVTQLWSAVIPLDLPDHGRRMRIWTDRIDAKFTAPVFPVGVTLECESRSRVREPLCVRIAVTTEVYQAGTCAAVFDAELRIVPAAVARNYEALKARQTTAPNHDSGPSPAATTLCPIPPTS